MRCPMGSARGGAPRVAVLKKHRPTERQVLWRPSPAASSSPISSPPGRKPSVPTSTRTRALSRVQMAVA